MTKPLAWMRRWAFDGVKPEKVRNPETNRMHLPFKFRMYEVTRGQCQDDDVPLVAASDSRWEYCSSRGTFPARAQDGETWVMFVPIGGRSTRSAFMGKSPEEAVDAAMSAQEGEDGTATERNRTGAG